jgi:hypothetical protein
MTKAEKVEWIKEYRAAQKTMRELEKKYKSIGKDVFKAEVKELFDAHPDLISFGWRQYTPSFNDGEPCTFRCYKDSPTVNGKGEWDEEDDVLDYPTLTDDQYDAICKAVNDVLDGYSDRDMEALFGDCVKLTVTRKGIETEEYQPY